MSSMSYGTWIARLRQSDDASLGPETVCCDRGTVIGKFLYFQIFSDFTHNTLVGEDVNV